MIFQNHSDGNLSKQTGLLLKHFALLNLITLHSNRMTQLPIFQIPYLKLLKKPYLNPRPVQIPRNLGLMMTVSRLLKNENMPKDHLKNLPSILSTFRIHRAKARRTIKQKKRASWKQFVSSINTGHL